jgi:hypothetical protein
MEENFAPHAASETIASPEATDAQPVEQPTTYAESNPTIGNPMGLLMFTVMYFITFGYYSIFWAYYNCKALSLPGKGKIGHLVYGIFLPVSLHEIIRKIETKAVEANHPIKMFAVPFGIAYFLLSAFNRLGHSVIGFIAGLVLFMILLETQSHINKINRAVHPYAWGLKPYNTAQKVLMSIFGVIIVGIFGLIIYGFTDPEILEEAGMDVKKPAPTNPLMFKTIPAINSK